jgi:UDP:flavonoid glycosyltransferase YjiC (YdhE family)
MVTLFNGIMTSLPLHHALLATVGLVRRYRLSKELQQRDITRARLSTDGAKTVRHFTKKSSFGQLILTLARFCCAILIAGGAAASVLNDTARLDVLFVDLGSAPNLRVLCLLLVALSWVVLSALIVEQWFSRLPLGRSVRAVALLVACIDSYAATSVNTLPTTQSSVMISLLWGFAALCMVCQYSGEYRHVVDWKRNVDGADANNANIRKASKSLRIVFLTIGTRGDVQPFVALGRALLKAGHRPVITTHNNFRSFIEENGIEFQYCGTEMDQPGLLGKAATGSNVYAWFREALKKITEPLYMTVNTHMYKACVGCDMIVSTGHTVGQAMDFAEKLNCLHWCCRLTPHEWFTRSFGAHSQRGSSCCGCWNLVHHYKYWSDVGTAYGEANIASLQQKFRTDVLQLTPADPGLSRIFEMFEVPTMFVVSRSVVPQPSDWPIPSNVTGWFFLDQDDYIPPNDLSQFLKGNGKDNQPPVCINFGSMVLVERTTFIKDAAVAALKCGRRVLLITGWASPPTDLPPECFCIRSVPHEYIFNKCCCVIHHGGAGTAARVLQAGVPSVVVPILIGTDQPWWANTIQDLNCGVHVRSQVEGTSPSTHDIEIALNRVLDGGEESKRVQTALLQVSKGINAENGVLNFVTAVTNVAENLAENKKTK